MYLTICQIVLMENRSSLGSTWPASKYAIDRQERADTEI